MDCSANTSPRASPLKTSPRINSTPLSMKSTTDRESHPDTEDLSRFSKATSLHLTVKSASRYFAFPETTLAHSR